MLGDTNLFLPLGWGPGEERPPWLSSVSQRPHRKSFRRHQKFGNTSAGSGERLSTLQAQLTSRGPALGKGVLPRCGASARSGTLAPRQRRRRRRRGPTGTRPAGFLPQSPRARSGPPPLAGGGRCAGWTMWPLFAEPRTRPACRWEEGRAAGARALGAPTVPRTRARSPRGWARRLRGQPSTDWAASGGVGTGWGEGERGRESRDRERE